VGVEGWEERGSLVSGGGVCIAWFLDGRSGALPRRFIWLGLSTGVD